MNLTWELCDKVKEDLLSQLVHYSVAFETGKEGAVGCFLESLAALRDAGIHNLNDLLIAYPTEKQIRESLTELDPEILVFAEEELLRIANVAFMNPDDIDEDENLQRCTSRVEDIFLLRTRWERRLLGASLLVEDISKESLSQEQQEALNHFDSSIEDKIWKFTFTNEMRAGHSMQIAPYYRDPYYWWTSADDVSYKVAFFMDQVASLIARYPSYRKELQKCISFDHYFEGSGGIVRKFQREGRSQALRQLSATVRKSRKEKR